MLIVGSISCFRDRGDLSPPITSERERAIPVMCSIAVSPDVARCLIEGGAAVNNQGGPHCDKVTPLIDAATNGHLDIVRLLVESGADVRLRDSHVSRLGSLLQRGACT